MDRSRSLRVGAFGVGRMGRVHLANLIQRAAAGDVELVAVGDRRGESLQAAVASIAACGLGVAPAEFSTPEAMADAARLDAVVVASRTEDHVRDAMAFTRRGVRVLVEKPLANSIREAAQFMEELGSEGSRLVQVAFQRRYDPAAELATAWVAGGLIGDLQQTDHTLQDQNPTPAAYQSCGITADMAIHLLFEAMSFRRWELPRTVQAVRFLAPHYEDRAGEGANVVHVFCAWGDRSVAHLWGSRINRTGYDNSFKLIGTGGRIDVGEFVGDFGVVSAKLWQGVGDGDGRIPRGTLVERREFPMTPSTTGDPDFHARYAVAYARELDAFLGQVRVGGEFEIGPEIGWKTQLTAEVAEASSRRSGRLFELVRPDGGPIESANDAVAFAEAAALT